MIADFETTRDTFAPIMKMTSSIERRKDRRRSFEGRQLTVDQVDPKTHKAVKIGMLLDLSTSGLRFKTGNTGLSLGSIIQVRLTLPSYTGISPFLIRGSAPVASSQWTGWMTVSRIVQRMDGTHDVAGEMMGLDDADIGMLGLYLSTQPVAA